MPKSELCALCQAGISKPITPRPEFARSVRRFLHPGFPMSRLCALATFPCGDGKVELTAWDPSDVGNWNQKPLQINYSHILRLAEDTYFERPRVSITEEDLAAAGLRLVCTRTDCTIWKYDFVPDE